MGVEVVSEREESKVKRRCSLSAKLREEKKRWRVTLGVEIVGHNSIKPLIVEAKDKNEAERKAQEMIDDKYDWEYMQEEIEPIVSFEIKKIERLK